MEFKKLLPFENLILTTKLSVAEVTKRLTDNIEIQKTSKFFTLNNHSSKLYRGTILNNNFKISRIINYRNSFLPIISGSIYSAIGKTEVEIKMRLHQFVFIFILIWFSAVGLVCLVILFAALVQFKKIIHEGFSPAFLIPFVMFIIFYLMLFFAFKLESKKSIQFFEALLDAEVNQY